MWSWKPSASSNILPAAAALVVMAFALFITQQQRSLSASDRRVHSPLMYKIYPQAPDVTVSPTTSLHIEAFSGLSQLEQIAVFQDAPSKAASCTLGWSQAQKPNRVFFLKANTVSISITQLSVLPNGNITFSSIGSLADSPEEISLEIDFTSWHDAQLGERDHIAGPVRCGGEIYLKIVMQRPDVDSGVYMEQDDLNGLWIDYEMGSSSTDDPLASDRVG